MNAKSGYSLLFIRAHGESHTSIDMYLVGERALSRGDRKDQQDSGFIPLLRSHFRSSDEQQGSGPSMGSCVAQHQHICH